MGDTARACAETVHESIGNVATLFKFRAILSLAGIGITAGLGFIGIVATVNEVDGNLAVFIGGVIACNCAFNMLTNWGAADGHGRLALLVAAGHERLNVIFTGRLDGIEKIERETGEAVVIALDDLRDLRERRKRQGM